MENKWIKSKRKRNIFVCFIARPIPLVMHKKILFSCNHDNLQFLKWLGRDADFYFSFKYHKIILKFKYQKQSVIKTRWVYCHQNTTFTCIWYESSENIFSFVLLICWLVFSANFSRISDILWCEQNLWRSFLLEIRVIGNWTSDLV